MADNKEDIIFQLKVEGSDAFSQMEKFKKSILETKQQQADLTKAYKQGHITLDEFVKEQVRMEAVLKRQQASYNNVQKSVTGVKTQLDKLIDSNKKISKSFEETAKGINVAGFNMGDLTTKMAAFANPATAAVGIVTALGAAYANSTIGARDLKHATDQLSSAFTIAGNEYAGFLDNLVGGDGTGKGGFLSAIALAFNARLFGVTTAFLAKLSADAKRDLQELELAELDSKRRAKDALGMAEELRRTRDREDLDLKSRLNAAYDVQQFIDKREAELVDTQNKRLKSLTYLLSLDKENLEIKRQIKLVEFEIADIQEDSEGKRTEALKGIIKLENDLLEKAKKDADVTGGKKLQIIPSQYENEAVQAKEFADFLNSVQLNQADREIELKEQTEAEKTAIERAEARKRALIADAERQAKVDAATMVLDSIANLAEDGTAIQRVAALLSIGVNTADALTGGIKAAQSVPFPGNLLAMATTTAAILGAIANAKSAMGFAEGGWTGPGDKYKPVGIVHADEYVTPKHIVHSPAAQPHLAALERMRLQGYADGGLAVNSLTAETNQSLMMMNMIKRMPVPELNIKEVTRYQNRIAIKENISKRGKA